MRKRTSRSSRSACAPRPGLLSLVLAAAWLLLPAPVAAASAPEPTACRVSLRGGGGSDGGHDVRASLACQGSAPLAVGLHASLAPQAASFSGVSLQPGGCGVGRCLVTLCKGSSSNSSARVVLEGLSISGVHAPPHLDAVLCIAGGRFTISAGARLEGTRGAAALRVAGAAVVDAVGLRVVNNSLDAAWPRDAFGAGVLVVDRARASFQGGLFEANSAVASPGRAMCAALCVGDDAEAHVAGAVLRSNSAWSLPALLGPAHKLPGRERTLAAGGAVAAWGTSRLSIARCRFNNNSCEGLVAAGGAVAVVERAQASIRASSFSSNRVRSSGVPGGLNGGGALVVVQHAAATVQACVFTGNAVVPSSQRAAASDSDLFGWLSMAPVGSFGGAIATNDHAQLSVEDSTLAGNVDEAKFGCGGGLALMGDAVHRLSNTLVLNNTVGDALHSDRGWSPLLITLHNAMGGGVCASDNVQLLIKNCTIAHNSAVLRLSPGMARGGGLIVFGNATRVTLQHSQLVHNTVISGPGAGGGGGGAYALLSARLVIRDSLVANNSASCVSGCTGAGVAVANDAVLEAVASNFTSNVLSPHGEEHDSALGGGGIGARHSALVRVEGCRFKDNDCVGHTAMGGGILGADETTIDLVDSVFLNNHAMTGAGIGGLGKSWVVRSCLISNHTALGAGGGGVYLLGDVQARFINSVISHNKASQGGGVYLLSTKVPHHVELRNTLVTHNQAGIGGGCLLAGGHTVFGHGTRIEHNLATTLGGGVTFIHGLLPLKSHPASVDMDCSVAITHNTAVVAGGGVYFNQTNDMFTLRHGGCLSRISHSNRAAFGNPDAFQVRGSTCGRGERRVGDWCETCPPETYSFEAWDDRCHNCPVDAVCRGGDSIVPEDGHWHSSNVSAQIHACPNPAACRPRHPLPRSSDPAFGFASDWQCAEGYSGPVCGACALPGYGLTTPFKCTRCLSPAWVAIAGHLASQVMVLLLLCAVTAATWRDNQVPPTDMRLSDVLKTLILWLWYLHALSTAAAPWPHSLAVFFDAASFVVSGSTGQLAALDCWVPQHLRMQPQPAAAVLLLVFRLMLPLAMAACVQLAHMAAWACMWLHRRTRRPPRPCLSLRAWLVPKIPSILLVILFYYYPALVRAALAPFACFRVDAPGPGAAAAAPAGYWVYNFRQPCGQGAHLVLALALGLPCVLVFCIAAPLGVVAWLLRNKERILRDDPHFRHSFGFLFRNVKHRVFWYEGIIMSTTVALICCMVLGTALNAFHLLMLLCLVFAASVVLQLLLRPYAFRRLHELQLLASSSLCISSFVSLSFFNTDTEHRPVEPVYKEVAGGLLVCMNGAFVLWCIIVMLRFLWAKLCRMRRVKCIVSPAAARAGLPSADFRRSSSVFVWGSVTLPSPPGSPRPAGSGSVRRPAPAAPAPRLAPVPW